MRSSASAKRKKGKRVPEQITLAIKKRTNRKETTVSFSACVYCQSEWVEEQGKECWGKKERANYINSEMPLLL